MAAVYGIILGMRRCVSRAIDVCRDVVLPYDMLETIIHGQMCMRQNRRQPLGLCRCADIQGGAAPTI